MSALNAVSFFDTAAIDKTRYLSGATATATSASGDASDFAGILSGLLETTNGTEAYDQLTGLDLANGNIDDLHTPMIAAQQAELSLRLTIAVRNKIVDAYSEIMRMQV